MSNFKRWITMIIILLHILSEHCFAERLGDLMYQSVIGSSACFRRLNGTHQMGCTSPASGSIGVIHVVKSEADSTWIVENGTAPPYTVIIDIQNFNKEIANYLIDHPSAVAGIVLYYNVSGTDKHKPNHYSMESTCPNELYSAPGSTCPSMATGWNPQGMDLLRRDIQFPIFYVPPARLSDVDSMIDCFQKFNAFDLESQHGRALCAVELNSFMFAAANSEVCFRRTNLMTNINTMRFCDPLADRNIYSTLFPRMFNASESTQKNSVQRGREGDQSVLLLTARLDSASLVDGFSPGAASTVAGIAIFLSTAKLLTQMLPMKDMDKYSKNVIFAMFNGEAFDYIGSQRVAYDMLRSEWPPGPSPPLPASSVSLHVEIGQLGGAILQQNTKGYPLNIFTPKTDTVSSDMSNAFIQSLASEGSKVNVTVKTLVTDNLPPSSLHSFRRVTKDGVRNQMEELLLTDHGNEGFSNRFYHSVLDDIDNLDYTYRNVTSWSDMIYGEPTNFMDVSKSISGGFFKWNDTQVVLANISTAIARAVYTHITGTIYVGDGSSPGDASPQLMDEILYCYLVSVHCPLFYAAALATWKKSDGSGDGESTNAAEFTTSSPDESEDDKSNGWIDYTWPTEKLPPPAPLYVGVSAWYGAATIGTAQTLTLFTGQPMTNIRNSSACQRGSSPDDKERVDYFSGKTKIFKEVTQGFSWQATSANFHCVKVNSEAVPGDGICEMYFNYLWQVGWSGTGECFRTTVNYTLALSPAFIIPDYDFSSHEYSTWTESLWQNLYARMFVIPHGRGAKAAVSLGTVATVLAIIVAFWMRKHAAVLFGELKIEDDTLQQSRAVQC